MATLIGEFSDNGSGGEGIESPKILNMLGN